MSVPFYIIPGSDAAKAAQRLETIHLTPANYNTELRGLLSDYGVDKVTQDAVLETANQINNFQPPYTTDPVSDKSRDLAQALAANAVADPRVAAGKAEQRVLALKGKDDAEIKAAAIDAAGDEAEKAGGKRADAEKKAKSLMGEGVSPEMAASAATAFVVAEAVAVQPSSGLQIFGHLKALVQNDIDEKYFANETKTVTGKSNQNYGPTFKQDTANTLEIDCKNYLAQAFFDFSIIPKSNSEYLQGYTFKSPAPLSIIPTASLSAYIGTGTVALGVVSRSLCKVTFPLIDMYVAIVGKTEASNAKDKATKIIGNKFIAIEITGYTVEN